MYFIGLFVMTIGIALSVKSNLGVSPVSSIPYTITCVWGIEMGKATILFHIALVLIQILVLRKNFKPVQLLQILIGVVFGYFTTFCNYMVSFLPTPDNLGIRILMVLASTVFVAVGIFLYLPADLIPLAGEGCMQAVSTVTHIEFAKVKIGFDCTMVLVSAVTCLTILHSLGSVGIGTIIAAVLVGTLVGIINRAFGRQRDRLLGKTDEPVVAAEDAASNYVITISRIFISADAASEAVRVSARDHISPEAAAAKVKKVNHERAVHCKHFTKTDWGNVKNYDLCIKSDDFGVNETAQIIADLFKKKMKL